MNWSRLIPAGGLATLLLAVWAQSQAANNAELQKLVSRINAVGNEGAANQDAANAWKELIQHGEASLFASLEAIDTAKSTPANWFRTAIDAIVESEMKAKRPLPAEKLERFLKDTKHAPVSRRIAYELLVKADPKSPDRLLPDMLNDPSADMRRDALAAAMDKVEPLVKTDPTKAKAEYRKLFEVSRDQDQIEKIAKSLYNLNELVDITAHLNVIWKWQVVGPFPGGKEKGFTVAYEPEKKIDLKATYKGKEDKEIRWQSFWSLETYGEVNLNTAIGKYKDAVGYAFAAIDSPKEQDVEIRLGSIVAIGVFLNGQKVFSWEEYHHGQAHDQYTAKVKLKKGRNEILVKVNQNNQSEPWAQEWSFQLRICDATGGAVPFQMIFDNP